LAFHDVQFPPTVAYGAQGGPTWSTNVASLSRGAEQRNQNWVNARHRYNVETGIKTLAGFSTVLAFFHTRRGRLHAFHLKYWGDFATSASPEIAVLATDQALGNYANTPMQIVKVYGDAGGSWTRTLRKPVAGTVRVAVAGIEQVAGSWTWPWSVELATGLLTFIRQNCP